MNRLPVLRSGDVVDIVAPASACAVSLLDAGCDLLRAWGLQPRVPDGMFGPPWLYAAEDAVRLAQLCTALRAPDSRAIWAVRGGYGCTRLLPALSRLRKPPASKVMIGFSDITALLSFAGERWSMPVLHAANLSMLARGELAGAHSRELEDVLFGRRREIALAGLRPLNAPARREGEVRGRLAGGNLKLFQSLLGTPWQPDWRGALVVLEDVDERGYAIDRMLTQLRQAGSLRGVRGVVFGEFIGGREPDGRTLHRRVMAEFAASARFPIFDGAPIGHGRRLRPLPLGMMASLHTGTRGRLQVQWTLSGRD